MIGILEFWGQHEIDKANTTNFEKNQINDLIEDWNLKETKLQLCITACHDHD